MTQQHFIYFWMDKTRKMFYVGSHSGSIDDMYVSSSKWLSGEIRYRPSEFKRRIVKFFDTREEMLKVEYEMIKTIKEEDYGRKYYNLKGGKPKGVKAWNSGKTGVYSEKTIAKMSEARKGKSTWNKGKSNPVAAENGRKGASKLAATATGRKRKYNPDGTWSWEYPAG